MAITLQMVCVFQHYESRAYVARAVTAWALVIMVLSTGCGAAAAEQSPPSAPPLGSPSAAMPDSYKINMLIRTTLIALSQANQTGNYSVLRDLGTPQFAAINSVARLAEIFAGIRLRKLDLSPVIFFEPKLIREPVLQDDGMLRMTGFIDTRPERVLFDMGFQSVEGQWRLAAIVVDIKAPKAESKLDAPPTKVSKSAPNAKAKVTKPPATTTAH